MKPLIGIWLASLFLNAGAAQATQISVDSFSVYFREVQEVTKEHATLWNRDIYGPILMVDPETREIGRAHV